MWIKSKDKIIDEFNKQERNCETKKKKDTKYPEVDKALFEWFRHLRDRSVKVNGPIMPNTSLKDASLQESIQH